jgi:hypothetical protein
LQSNQERGLKKTFAASVVQQKANICGERIHYGTAADFNPHSVVPLSLFIWMPLGLEPLESSGPAQVDKPASWFIEAAKPLKKKSLRES